MQTYSVNRCAEMLERDRATVIRALKNTPRDAGTASRPQYKIATASREVERHLRANGGGNGGGIDPTLQALFDEHFAAEARMRTLPTLEARREAASAMLPLIVEMDKATRRIGISRGQDSDCVHLRADQLLRLYARGIEGPCQWSHDQVWEMILEAEDA